MSGEMVSLACTLLGKEEKLNDTVNLIFLTIFVESSTFSPIFTTYVCKKTSLGHRPCFFTRYYYRSSVGVTYLSLADIVGEGLAPVPGRVDLLAVGQGQGVVAGDLSKECNTNEG